jgi:MFS family permease
MFRVIECLFTTVREQSLPAAAVSPCLWALIAVTIGRSAVLWSLRFAFKWLVPALQVDMHWTYTEADALNVAIAVGCFISAFLTPRTEQAFGSKRSFVCGLVISVTALASMFVTHDLLSLLVLWFIAGLATGPMFVCGLNLVTHAGVKAAYEA